MRPRRTKHEALEPVRVGENTAANKTQRSGHDVAWGLLRLFLGFAQMWGAVWSAYLLWEHGPTTTTLGAAAATTMLTALSRFLFRAAPASH